MKIQTVIFDVGNVLAAFRWKDYLQAFGFSPAFQEELGRILFLDPLWFEWDRGVMTEDEIVEIFCGKHPDYRAEIHRVLDNPYDLVREYPDSADWIREVHGLGRQALLLSNYSRKTFTYAYEHFDSLKLTDGGVISYQEKIVKPEPEIYRRLIDRYALDSAACVFLDDSPANCQGAEDFGIRTILVQDRAAARRELRKLLA